jgi:hypothetical protein
MSTGCDGQCCDISRDRSFSREKVPLDMPSSVHEGSILEFAKDRVGSQESQLIFMSQTKSRGSEMESTATPHNLKHLADATRPIHLSPSPMAAL